MADEQFFHKDFEETLKPVYGDDINPEDLVVEGGVVDSEDTATEDADEAETTDADAASDDTKDAETTEEPEETEASYDAE